MSGSRHVQLYSHLIECQDCRISNESFCGQAKAMGEQYEYHLDGFSGAKRGAVHDEFVNAVVRGRIKQWYESKLKLERA